MVGINGIQPDLLMDRDLQVADEWEIRNIMGVPRGRENKLRTGEARECA